MVTVADASPESQQATPGRHAAPRSHLPVSVVAIIAATGVLLVAAAYTAGRFGHANSSWADRTYWLGQALIVVPVAVRLLSRRLLTAAQTVLLVLWKTVPRSETGNLIKLFAYLAALLFMGLLAGQGKLYRTRPILPGEVMVE